MDPSAYYFTPKYEWMNESLTLRCIRAEWWRRRYHQKHCNYHYFPYQYMPWNGGVAVCISVGHGTHGGLIEGRGIIMHSSSFKIQCLQPRANPSRPLFPPPPPPSSSSSFPPSFLPLLLLLPLHWYSSLPLLLCGVQLQTLGDCHNIATFTHPSFLIHSFIG